MAPPPKTPAMTASAAVPPGGASPGSPGLSSPIKGALRSPRFRAPMWVDLETARFDYDDADNQDLRDSFFSVHHQDHEPFEKLPKMPPLYIPSPVKPGEDNAGGLQSESQDIGANSTFAEGEVEGASLAGVFGTANASSVLDCSQIGAAGNTTECSMSAINTSVNNTTIGATLHDDSVMLLNSSTPAGAAANTSAKLTMPGRLKVGGAGSSAQQQHHSSAAAAASQQLQQQQQQQQQQLQTRILRSNRGASAAQNVGGRKLDLVSNKNRLKLDAETEEMLKQYNEQAKRKRELDFFDADTLATLEAFNHQIAQQKQPAAAAKTEHPKHADAKPLAAGAAPADSKITRSSQVQKKPAAAPAATAKITAPKTTKANVATADVDADECTVEATANANAEPEPEPEAKKLRPASAHVAPAASMGGVGAAVRAPPVPKGGGALGVGVARSLAPAAAPAAAAPAIKSAPVGGATASAAAAAAAAGRAPLKPHNANAPTANAKEAAAGLKRKVGSVFAKPDASVPLEFDEDIMKMLHEHNSQFKKPSTYVPQKHTVSEIKEWEKENPGKVWHSMTPSERELANEEIALKKRRVQAGF